MTQGFLLFAHDNEQIEYGLLAIWTAGRIRRYLDKPTSLVADSHTLENLDRTLPNWRDHIDQIRVVERAVTQTKRYVDRALTFKNLTRADAWDLTPYDETQVIDTDIVIQSPQLNSLWGYHDDLIIMETSSDLFGRPAPEFDWIADDSVKFYWATQFYFRKTDTSHKFFKICQNIVNNYDVYRYIYRLPGGPVRNDHVWSITHHIMGQSLDTIPWNTPYSRATDRLVDLKHDSVRVLGNNLLAKVAGQDLHVMNKFDLIYWVKQELGV
jgi:hypothetical protein